MRAWDGLPGFLPALAAAVLVTAAAVFAPRLGAPRLVGRAVTVVALVLALARVLSPLVHLGYTSPIAQLHARLERERSQGRVLEQPIELPKNTGCIAQYYFADHYRIRAGGDEDGRKIWLEPKP